MSESPEILRGRLILRATICALGALMLAACVKPRQIPTVVEASAPDPLTVAISRVKEDRGEATGRLAAVQIPPELKHYGDRRLFLAVQLAEGRRLKGDVPQDFAELAGIIGAGRLVEMEHFSKDHLLYGVGEKATEGPFTHYDAATNSDVPLYPSYEDFRTDFDRLAQSIDQLKAERAQLERQFGATDKRDRARRHALLREIIRSRKSVAAAEKNKKLLAAFYQDSKRFKDLTAEYRVFADLAAGFGGRSYDLTKGEDRRQLKMRLLSVIRPEARSVLLEIAGNYRAKFDRPLPITSLVRSGDYQRHLRETNKSAAATVIPPHTTGLAFDIYDYYMSAAEQDYLMQEIARMKTSGRVEALREQRDHIHVFAFAEGSRPDDASISQAIGRKQGKRAGKSAKPGRT